MNKIKITNFLLSIVMMVVIISISVCAILFCKPIYNLDIQYSNVQEELAWGVEHIERNLDYLKTNEDIDLEKYNQLIQKKNMSIDELKYNYSVLIDYQSIFYQGELEFPDFPMSKSGEKHFREVKVVFEIVQLIAMVGGALGVVLTIKKLVNRDFIYFKMVAFVTFIVPAIIGLLASINFNKIFTIFHQIVFRNDDWLFDYMLDPIILVLPEVFFLHCLIGIIALVILFCIIHYIIGKKLEKKWMKTIEG